MRSGFPLCGWRRVSSQSGSDRLRVTSTKVWFDAPRTLDPFKGIIRARLALSELSAARLFEEVRAAGYSRGYDQVKRHVREVRPREPVQPPLRFETPPGHQGQVDFAEFRLPWGRRHALIVVLGCSRRMWLGFYERWTMGVVIRGLEESFDCFGGVPEEMLFDQIKAVVLADGRNSGGRLVESGRCSVPWPASVPADRAEARAFADAGTGASHPHHPEGRRRRRPQGDCAIRGEIAATAPSRRRRIAAQLADLKMPGALESLVEVLAGMDGGGLTAAEAIASRCAVPVDEGGPTAETIRKRLRVVFGIGGLAESALSDYEMSSCGKAVERFGGRD